jgi:hypothetical protein
MELPYKDCPTCGLHWHLFAPAKIDGKEAVRCVECKAVYPLSAQAEPGYVANRETIAEAMWRGELRRAAGKERNIPWSEVSETDQARWLYLADAAIAALPAPATAGKEVTVEELELWLFQQGMVLSSNVLARALLSTYKITKRSAT